MGYNRTYRGESKEHRLKRFQDSHPIEAIETLLNSIDNFFNNEIRLTPTHFQTVLMFIGVHAAALTIGEAFFNEDKELDNYRKFLETFVDGETEDRQFSRIAEIIHNWRNILAHQWLGSLGHEIGYDYEMSLGWQKRDEMIFINPKIYCETYVNAFSAGGKIWRYDSIFTAEQLEEIKQRIIDKYIRR